MQAEAFSPGHITGFVQFPILTDDPLRNGSLGAGICIDKGVRTDVTVESADKNSFSIMINGKQALNAEVSEHVLNQYLALSGMNWNIIVNHESAIPIGYGLGSSGAAALSLSYALNQALETDLTAVEAAQIAHKADLACRCGVGTVIAEYYGGFEMRYSPGAPGIGRVEKVPVHGRKVMLLCMEPVSTKDFLMNRMHLINGLGGKLLSKLAATKSIDDFMQMSKEFSQYVGFMKEESKEVMKEMNNLGYKCSCAMFGQTIFTIVSENETEEARRLLANRCGMLLTSDIDNGGARLC